MFVIWCGLLVVVALWIRSKMAGWDGLGREGKGKKGDGGIRTKPRGVNLSVLKAEHEETDWPICKRQLTECELGRKQLLPCQQRQRQARRGKEEVKKEKENGTKALHNNHTGCLSILSAC